MKKYMSPSFLLFLLLSSTFLYTQEGSSRGTTKYSKEHTQSEKEVARGMLIFLDDYEREEAQSEDKIGPLTNGLLSAFLGEASPILVSASLLFNTLETKKLSSRDKKKLRDKFLDYSQQGTLYKKENIETYKKFILSYLDLKTTLDQEWIIKEVNPFLYLLMSKSYLKENKIPVTQYTLFQQDAQVTNLEIMLGLKVNHMKTVMIGGVKQAASSETADYFMPVVWNNNNESSSIFVTRKEYFSSHSAEEGELDLPWVIYLDGHGSIKESVAGLSIESFKDFLYFLETKLNTKLLYYSSCASAGVNSNILYNNSNDLIKKSYSFALMTDSIPDGGSYGGYLNNSIVTQKITFFNKEGTIELKPWVNYYEFLKRVTTQENLDYPELVTILKNNLLYQVKLPGLPWFQIINKDYVVSIGSLLSKTRTQPLRLSTFFKNSTGLSQPAAIALYAQDVPFELIVDSSLYDKKSPFFISMLPGIAAHHLTKITAKNYEAEDILNSFIQNNLGASKLFLIDEIEAIPSNEMKELMYRAGILGTGLIKLSQVLVQNNTINLVIYFKYNNILYCAQYGLSNTNFFRVATSEEREKYEFFINKTIKVIQNKVKPSLASFQEKKDELARLFKNKLEPIQSSVSIKILAAYIDGIGFSNITKIPVMYIVKEDVKDKNYIERLEQLSMTYGLQPGAVVWIEQIEEQMSYHKKAKKGEKNRTLNIYKNVIIRVKPDYSLDAYYTDEDNNFFLLSQGVRYQLDKDYTIFYKKLLKHFNAGKKINLDSLEPALQSSDSVYKELTPEAVNRINSSLEQKIIDSSPNNLMDKKSKFAQKYSSVDAGGSSYDKQPKD